MANSIDFVANQKWSNGVGVNSSDIKVFEGKRSWVQEADRIGQADRIPRAVFRAGVRVMTMADRHP
jgi:hypothetical protein